MHDSTIPLEDEFGDILLKAMRGTGFGAERLAADLGVDAPTIAGWLAYDGAASDAQARKLAGLLGLDPSAFAQSAAKCWRPPQVETPDVRRHAQAPHPSNGYVFALDGGRRAALVDPAGNAERLLRVVREGGYDLEYVLITHKHSDHCDAAGAVAAAHPQAQILMHQLDVHAIGALAQRARPIRDGEELAVGDGVRIRTFHTPGHTDGSACFFFASRDERTTLFTGDMLFAGSVGGAYGGESTYADILASIGTKLFALPAETAVMPGHGPPTTIAHERAHNPFFPRGDRSQTKF